MKRKLTSLLTDVDALLLDIEGTTTSIKFVHDKLFPYVKENIQQYLKDHWLEPECQNDVQALRGQAVQDAKDKIEGVVDVPPDAECGVEDIQKAVISNVLWQMSFDRKCTALKQLQGHMWSAAFKNGAIKGHVYDDVVPTLEQWKADNGKIFIYSSGSIEAQKLIFGFSEKGDMLQLLDGHFDTTTGLKVEAASYTKIANKIGVKPDKILFLTDVTREAVPAAEAGMKVALAVRPGNAPITDEDKSRFTIIQSFSELYEEADTNIGQSSKLCRGSPSTVKDESQKDLGIS